MRLSCTTLACPEWSLDEILTRFRQYGYDAVDFRGLGTTTEIFRMPEFTTDLAATVKKVQKSGLPVSAFSSSANMFAALPADREKWLEEVRQYTRLCKAFDCKLIRVFGGALDNMPLDQAIAISVETLHKMCDAAGEGIMIAVETHDAWMLTSQIAQVMSRISRPNLGVLWDLHHPYRFCHETPKQTYDNIGKYVVATHVKDSIPTPDGKYRYVLGGEGDVPLGEMIALLRKGGYKGDVTLEWEKRWIPDLPGPEIALPQYAKYLRPFLA